MIKLKTERLAAGESQAELARRAHLHPTTISLIESRRFLPGPGQLSKLARALGLPQGEAASLLDEVPDTEDERSSVR